MNKWSCLPIALARLTKTPFETVLRAFDDPENKNENLTIADTMIAGYRLGYLPAIVPAQDLGVQLDLDDFIRYGKECIIFGIAHANGRHHAIYFSGEHLINDNDAILNTLEINVEGALVFVKKGV